MVMGNCIEVLSRDITRFLKYYFVCKNVLYTVNIFVTNEQKSIYLGLMH